MEIESFRLCKSYDKVETLAHNILKYRTENQEIKVLGLKEV